MNTAIAKVVGGCGVGDTRNGMMRKFHVTFCALSFFSSFDFPPVDHHSPTGVILPRLRMRNIVLAAAIDTFRLTGKLNGRGLHHVSIDVCNSTERYGQQDECITATPTTAINT